MCQSTYIKSGRCIIIFLRIFLLYSIVICFIFSLYIRFNMNKKINSSCIWIKVLKYIKICPIYIPLVLKPVFTWCVQRLQGMQSNWIKQKTWKTIYDWYITTCLYVLIVTATFYNLSYNLIFWNKIVFIRKSTIKQSYQSLRNLQWL